MNEEESRRLLWHRLKIVGLIAVFVAPFLAGWLALYVFEIRPPNSNYGELIEPVKKLDWPLLKTTDGRTLEGGFGRKWTLLLFAGDNCAAQCRSNLFYLRQLRILLGRDTARLQNVLVLAQPLGDEMRTLLIEYPDLIVIENNRDERLYSQFRLPQVDAIGNSAKLYLVDPDQNLMMHYPAQIEQNRVLDDIRKLMKLSQIG